MLRYLSLVALAVGVPLARGTAGVAGTPPMGWNSWNHFGCSLNGTIVKDTADQFVKTGLQQAGYLYVNMDDCWMLANRSADGKQVPNPEKFPDGLPSVIQYVHSKGLKFGLYTARAPHTCAGFAASCQHEDIDAQQWADWEVDYLKDDSCGTCREVLQDYKAMQDAIDKTQRKIVLSVEGEPDVPTCSGGGYGNLRRVGHDIQANWFSMISLVDIASNLWPYAHNDTGFGGWWNDLDMIEIGNGEFIAETSPAQLNAARVHMSLWCMLKAPLLLGNDLTMMGPKTLGVLTNPEAIAINQDPLGVQARRIISAVPKNTTLAPPYDVLAVLAPCDPSSLTQRWRVNVSEAPGGSQYLYIAPCNQSDPRQQWSFASGAVKNLGTGQCVDAGTSSDPAGLAACDASRPQQQWELGPSTLHIRQGRSSTCLDVYNFNGPDVFQGSCKAPGDNDSNQKWDLDPNTKLVRTEASADKCLAALNGPPGTQVWTQDASGAKWCLGAVYEEIGGYTARPCNQQGHGQTNWLVGGGDLSKPGNFTFGLRWNMGWTDKFGASGPLPHTVYPSNSYGGRPYFSFDPTAAGGSAIKPQTDTLPDDDGIGNVRRAPAADFCLDLSRGGNLEVWAAPLTKGRLAVAFVNRSPADDTITVSWHDLGLDPKAILTVRDVWEAKDMGPYSGGYSSVVPTHGVALLVFTPAPSSA